jgi:hypothetical protein
LQTAATAVKTGHVAAALISSWTGWAPSALDRGERPEVPASSGAYGRLVDWYRQTFALASRYGLIGDDWFGLREAWHAEAYRTFPGEPSEYYDHIFAAERLQSAAGHSEPLATGEYEEWYRRVNSLAVELGLGRDQASLAES